MDLNMMEGQLGYGWVSGGGKAISEGHTRREAAGRGLAS